MAAGDFTATVQEALSVKLATMYPGSGISNPELGLGAAFTLRALAERQTADYGQLMENGKCVGVKAYYMKGTNGQVTPPTDCVTPGGVESESVEASYVTSIIASTAKTARQGRCNNEIDFVEETAFQLNLAMASNRTALNALAINMLAANSQVNLDADKPATWVPTGNRLVIPTADFSFDQIGEFDAVAMRNLLGNKFYITGRNFNNAYARAKYNERVACCEGGALSAFTDMGMAFDLLDLDSVMTRRTTFAVDSDSYLLWNDTGEWGPIATQIDENTWTYTIADPLVLINRGGALVPLMHIVEAKRECTTRNALGNKVYSWKYYVRVNGGLQMAPAGASPVVKGVLQYSV